MRPLRWLTVLALGVLIVVVAVVLAGEIVLRPAVEGAIARDIERRYALNVTPQVRLEGTPFVLQAVRGAFDRVTVSAEDLTVEGLEITEVSLDADQVRFDGRSLLTGGVDQGTAARVDATITLTDAALNDYLARQGVALTLGFEGLDGPAVVASGRVTVAGMSVEGRARGEVAMEGGALRFTPLDVEVQGFGLPAAVTAGLRDGFAFTVPVPEVAGVQAEAIRVGPGTVTLRAEVTDYALAQASRT